MTVVSEELVEKASKALCGWPSNASRELRARAVIAAVLPDIERRIRAHEYSNAVVTAMKQDREIERLTIEADERLELWRRSRAKADELATQLVEQAGQLAERDREIKALTHGIAQARRTRDEALALADRFVEGQ